jgi:hypothetical protein
MGGVYYFAYQARKQAAYDKAQSFLESIIGMHQYYSSEIVPRIKASGGKFKMEYADEADVFPYPAAVSIDLGRVLKKVNQHLDTKIYSEFPFPIRRGRTLDRFEQESLVALKQNSAVDFVKFETRDGIEYVRYARAMTMRADCVACHNRPDFGFQGRWKLGDFRGAQQVSMPVPAMAAIIDSATYTAIFFAILASWLGAMIVLPIVRRLRTSLD